MRGCADLDQVGVPGVLRDTKVVVALFLGEYQYGLLRLCMLSSYLLCSLAKDVAWLQSSVPSAISIAEPRGTHGTWKLSRSGQPWLRFVPRLCVVNVREDVQPLR